MNIPIPEGETLLQVIKHEAPNKLILNTRIETCRGEFRAVIIQDREVIYTERAETRKQAESLTPEYIDWVFVQRRKLMSFVNREKPGAKPKIVLFPVEPTLLVVRA